MKKSIILGAVMLFSLINLNTSFADWGNLNNRQMDMVNNTVTNLNNKIGCDNQKFNLINEKINLLTVKNRASLKYSSTNEDILYYLSYQLETLFALNCSNNNNNYDAPFLDLFNEKKGDFVKELLPKSNDSEKSLEVRKNDNYIYFYYGDYLINTVKNEVKEDSFSIYGIEEPRPQKLDDKHSKRKINLYSAERLNSETILFKKQKDNLESNYIYYINTEEWVELKNFTEISKAERTPYGIILLGYEYSGKQALYGFYDRGLYDISIGTDNYYDFTFNGQNEIKILYKKYNGTTGSTKINLSDYIY